MGSVLAFFKRQSWVGQAALFAIFLFLSPAFMLMIFSHIFFWGCHSMIFGSSSRSDAAFYSGLIIMAATYGIGAISSVVWAIALIRAFSN